MTDVEIRQRLTDRIALAGTMWAEGRGDAREGHSSVEERLAIGCVCRNRLETRRWGTTYRAVCLAAKQFSCWNAGVDANHQALLALVARTLDGLLLSGDASDDPVFNETLYLAGGVIHGEILDRTNGALSYYAPAAMKPRGRVPAWAVGRVGVAIGTQFFFR